MKASKIDKYFVDVIIGDAKTSSNTKIEDVYYYCVWTYYWLTDINHPFGPDLGPVTRNLKGLGDVYESL